eukprot:scaffold454720_cov43-Prasinocladus_malaysianus.AAC.1
MQVPKKRKGAIINPLEALSLTGSLPKVLGMHDESDHIPLNPNGNRVHPEPPTEDAKGELLDEPQVTSQAAVRLI